MDAQYIKSKLNDSGIIKIINALGGELKEDTNDYFIFTSITYDIDGDAHKPKLYCYKSNYTFVEFHLSMDAIDVFDVVKERKRLLGIKYSFVDCMKFICECIGIDYYSNTVIDTNDNFVNIGLKRFLHKSVDKDLPIYSDYILNKFTDQYHQSWIDDNISVETMKKYNIKYYEFGNQIIIPCYDMYNNLIGIRARNLDPNATAKYVPYKDINYKNGINGWYKFNVGSTFFGLNHNTDAIRKNKKVIICESEKAVMQGDTYFGNNNIILGMYGSAMTTTKRDIVLSLDVDEVVIAIDFDYEEESYHNEELYERLTDWELYEKKVYNIADKFKGWCGVSVIIDYTPRNKKDCVTDYGKNDFLKFYKKRLEIY